jgi:hypothetical protein
MAEEQQNAEEREDEREEREHQQQRYEVTGTSPAATARRHRGCAEPESSPKAFGSLPRCRRPP